jgi:hypothetical protein
MNPIRFLFSAAAAVVEGLQLAAHQLATDEHSSTYKDR